VGRAGAVAISTMVAAIRHRRLPTSVPSRRSVTLMV
jgi:hypothetical protein